MDKRELNCLINGKSTSLSGKRFETKSPYYPDYSFLAADCGMFDIKNAASKASGAEKECNAISFDRRTEILKEAAKKLDLQNKEIQEYAVKMTGMPIHFVRQHLKEAVETLTAVPELVRQRLEITNGHIHHRPIRGADFYVIHQPHTGVLYSVTPGNDPRAVPFVAAWCVTLGIPAIIKPSKLDLLVSRTVMKAIVDAGYPPAGLNLVSWDTASPGSATKNFSLVDSAAMVWVFGDDATVDGLLRFEQTENQRIDHFSGKTILRHASGRGAALVDEHKDLNRTAKVITESAFNWPISCNATKAVFDASGRHEELGAKIAEMAEKEYTRNVGNPMDERTRVGFTEPKLLAHILKRIHELKRFSLIDELTPLQVISKQQSVPILLESSDVHSEFLSKEHSAYILCLKKCKNYEEATREINGISGENKRIAISVFCDDEVKVLKTHLHAHHVKRLRHSTELDIMYHEGNDYLYLLTLPQVHRCANGKV